MCSVCEARNCKRTYCYFVYEAMFRQIQNDQYALKRRRIPNSLARGIALGE